MRHQKDIAQLLALAFTSLLTSCGESTPSDSQAREIVEQSFADLRQLGAGPLVDFRKRNGELQFIGGQKMYVYSFLASTKLPAGVAWGQKAPWSNSGFMADPGPNWASQSMFSSSLEKPESLPAGTLAVRTGQLAFRLTEKGWIPQRNAESVSSAYCTNREPPECYKALEWDKPD